MTTSNQKRIDDILGKGKSNGEEEIDKSLSAQAYERATSGEPPTTLTPWEWEQWYAEHGMPEKFKEDGSGQTSSTKEKETAKPVWWKRIFTRKKEQKTPSATQPNCSRSPNEDEEF